MAFQRTVEKKLRLLHALVEERRMLEAAEKLTEMRRAKTKPIPESDTPRNAPCPCGSGLKHKRCCGHHALPVLNYGAVA